MLRTLINQRLGRYTITELLGRGGMAAVYRAVDTVLQRDVALKVLYPQYGDDQSLIERFTYTHSRGVIHRDIKPGNIFLSQAAPGPLQVMLTDFGIAKAIFVLYTD
jgi:serine/threonine protein kinase